MQNEQGLKPAEMSTDQRFVLLEARCTAANGGYILNMKQFSTLSSSLDKDIRERFQILLCP